MSAESLGASLESGNHFFLNKLVGEWSGEAKTWFEPGEPIDVSPMTGTIRALFDGRFVMHEYKGSFQGTPFEGIAIYGYHLKEQRYQSVWMDTFHMGTGFMFSEGNSAAPFFDVNGTYKAGEHNEQHWGWRTEIKLAEDDQLVITAYNITPSGEETKATETIYQKK